MTNSMPMARPGGLAGLYLRFLRLADCVPLSLVQLVSRVAVAHIFWQSAQTKLASWPATVQLFAMEYKLPVIDPGLAAVMATAAELTGSVLVFFGLFSRLAALLLLGVTAIIQIFVYPGNWAEHLSWTALLLLIFARGAGLASLDALAGRLLSRER